ncbi:hypothetical protein [Bradyrhizobium genosp. P]|uniref:hypothetical protein n=1 Tax=Bradyrhizobium genosp. P TaxID=83641 RepID=UPI003CE7926A
MPVEIEALDEVPEANLKQIIKEFASVQANTITAINDNKGTFTVEATFIDGDVDSLGSITQSGKMSTFGGPQDMGVSPDEGLALYDDAQALNAPAGLLLTAQPPGTTGLARRLNPAFNYMAYRWNYAVTPPDFLRGKSVTVSANGKSIMATPVDWGPNIDTGRIADLSPGLAHALGLNTDASCTVSVPIPDNVDIGKSPDPPTFTVDLKTIDANTFPTDMTRTLVVLTISGKNVYWLLNLTGPNEGGQTLMRQLGDAQPELLYSDTVILPIEPGASVPAAVAAELSKAQQQKQPSKVTAPAGPAPKADDDIGQRMFLTAQAFVGHVTSNVPGTDNGILACAWAVNEVARLALGKPISGTAEQNGLSTDDLFRALQTQHVKLGSKDDAKPGAIIIAPTKGAQHGHVGIVGAAGNGTVDATPVFSNQSVPGVFRQNFTIGSFLQYFEAKGLTVFFFALNPNAFMVS